MNGAHTGYASYYKHQIGGSGGIDVYSGALGQRGHGIGDILGGLLRGITPMFKTLGSSVGKSLLNVGMGTLDDVISGQHIGQSLKRRSMAAGKGLLKRGAQGLLNKAKPKRRKRSAAPRRKPVKQSGRGKKRKISRPRKKRTKSDIFGNI